MNISVLFCVWEKLPMLVSLCLLICVRMSDHLCMRACVVDDATLSISFQE